MEWPQAPPGQGGKGSIWVLLSPSRACSMGHLTVYLISNHNSVIVILEKLSTNCLVF